MTHNTFVKAIVFAAITLFSLYSCKQEHAENFLQQININTDSTNSINTLIEKDSIVQDSLISDKIAIQNPIDSTKKYIYLTFDDGPYKGSRHINQITKDEDIKATVFIVGMNAYTKDLKQLINDYKANDLIEIANHTYSHANRNRFKHYYTNPEDVLNDVNKNDTFFSLKSRFVRLPGRNTWRVGKLTKNDFDNGSKASSNLLADNQYYILGWDYEWNKINKKHPLDNPEIIYKGIMNRFDKNLTLTKNHLVLLMHDDMFDKEADAEKLRELVKMLKNDPDIIFEKASNYPIKLD